MATPAPRPVLSPLNPRATPAGQDASVAFATPAPAKLPLVTPLTRATSSGKWSTVALAKSPAEESALLRELSSVVKEHLDTVTKAAKRSQAEREAAEAAAAAELELIHAELATENGFPSEEKPACGWPENLSLRMSLWSMVSELSELISLPQALEMKASLQSWAEGGMLATVAVANMAVAGIQQRLLEAAPEGYEASEPSTPEVEGREAAEPPAALALPEPLAAVAPRAAAPAKRRKPLLLRLLFAGVVAAGAAAAALEARKQLEAKKRAAPPSAPVAPVLPAAEPAAPAAASA